MDAVAARRTGASDTGARADRARALDAARTVPRRLARRIVIVFFLPTMASLEQEKIAVIGLGYVGLPVALSFGRKLPTVGFDIRAAPRRRAQARPRRHARGHATSSSRRRRKLEMTADPAKLADCTFYIVAVPTPIDTQQPPRSHADDHARRARSARTSRRATSSSTSRRSIPASPRTSAARSSTRRAASRTASTTSSATRRSASTRATRSTRSRRS